MSEQRIDVVVRTGDSPIRQTADIVEQLFLRLDEDTARLALFIMDRLIVEGASVTITTDEMIDAVGWSPRSDEERGDMRYRVVELAELASKVDVVEVSL